MLGIYINEVDRTADYKFGSFNKQNQIQQRADSCTFTLVAGAEPQNGDVVEIYKYDVIESIDDRTISLKGYFEKEVLYFYPDQELKLQLQTGFEETVYVESYDEENLELVLTKAPAFELIENALIGEKIFSGQISNPTSYNKFKLQNLKYDVVCVGHEKFFDKKQISDSWSNKDARYIVNDTLNRHINHARTLDDLYFEDDASLQAAYIESGDALDPVVDLDDFIEREGSSVFEWENSTNQAKWTGSFTPRNTSPVVDSDIGEANDGFLMFWVKTSNYGQIDSIIIRIGTDNSNYIELTSPELKPTTDWQYVKIQLLSGEIEGIMDWQAVEYAEIIINNNGDGLLKMNGLRINDSSAFTPNNVSPTTEFSSFRAPQIKPMAFMNLLAKTFEYNWYIDYDRDIHLISLEDEPAPFDISPANENFFDLNISIDGSQLGNRIIVEGGEILSEYRFSQVFRGDNTQREWLLKNKFQGLEIFIDDGSSQLEIEAINVINPTLIRITVTGHGLEENDHIVMRDRDNAVRQVFEIVDNDNFIIQSVDGLLVGDNFSIFSTTKSSGIEGIVDELTVDYVQNSNEKSVRATESEMTLAEDQFIRFEYFERLKLQIQYSDAGNINALKAKGFGDGIYDLDKIVDNNLDDQGTALALAKAKINDFKNPIINGNFQTDKNGLRAGQLLRVIENVKRNLDEDFIIQTIASRQVAGKFSDYFEHTVVFGTTLFGYIEFFQKLLATKDKIAVNTDAIVSTFATANEIIEINESAGAALGGFQKVGENETIELNETDNTVLYDSGRWRAEDNLAGQPLRSRCDLCDVG